MSGSGIVCIEPLNRCCSSSSISLTMDMPLVTEPVPATRPPMKGVATKPSDTLSPVRVRERAGGRGAAYSRARTCPVPARVREGAAVASLSGSKAHHMSRAQKTQNNICVLRMKSVCRCTDGESTPEITLASTRVARRYWRLHTHWRD